MPNSNRLKIVFAIFKKKIARHFILRKSQHLISPINSFKLPEIWQKINGLLMLKGRAFPRCIAINNSYAIQLEFTVAFWCKGEKKSYEKSISSFLGQQICRKEQANKKYWKEGKCKYWLDWYWIHVNCLHLLMI